MLETIKITNLALISKSVVNFGEGFNVLTGETGAGKSLIVDALLFLTGTRADKTLIKSGEEFAKVEGVFSVDVNNIVLNELLSSVDIENEGTLIISRIFSINGKNECRINGELVTLNTVRKISKEIIDIFGQNDSMELLNSDNHLALIDTMIEDKLVNDKCKLQKLLSELSEINNSIKELGGLDENRERTISLLKFQIDEINNANLKCNEEEEIKSQIVVMQNSEKIHNALNSAIELIDGEYSISNVLKTAINTINSIVDYDNELNSEKERLYSLKYEIEDIVDNLNSKKDCISYSEYDLDKLNERLSEIKDLERKYGNTIDDIINIKEVYEKKLEKLLNADEELERLRLNKKQKLKDIYLVCTNLRKIRETEIIKISELLINELKKLGMKNANFNVVFNNELSQDNIESIVTPNGGDQLEFMFSANLGVELRPLNKVISGGEMSRFMLAFKALQNSNQKKTCIFDEIDTGIGGEIGTVVGHKICEISKNNQVICITHLPQIASFGDSNYKIEKYDENMQTFTQVKLLNIDEKVTEIARMLGSSSNSTSISHAKEIIDECDYFKSYLSH